MLAFRMGEQKDWFLITSIICRTKTRTRRITTTSETTKSWSLVTGTKTTSGRTRKTTIGSVRRTTTSGQQKARLGAEQPRQRAEQREHPRQQAEQRENISRRCSMIIIAKKQATSTLVRANTRARCQLLVWLGSNKLSLITNTRR